MSEAPLPSATVVLLRDSHALELLLLQRAPHSDGRPGPWVFPGGKVDAADRIGLEGEGESDDHRGAALRAAVRETREEAGLAIAARELVPISRWITPEIAPRRFDTWFFLSAIASEGRVQVDGSEIVDHRWTEPSAALDAHHGGEIRLAPPTFVTVTWLAGHARAEEALRKLGAADTLTFRPRICRVEGGACMLYPGDAGYERGDPEAAGPRHRLWALPDYCYERSGA